MSEIINLRRARKEKARAAKAKDACENRTRHGVVKSLRSLTEGHKDKAARDLDAHKLKDE